MDHHPYLSTADIYRRQADTDPVEWQRESRDYTENLIGILAIVKRLVDEIKRRAATSECIGHRFYERTLCTP